VAFELKIGEFKPEINPKAQTHMPTKQVPKHIGNSLVGIFVAISIDLLKLVDVDSDKHTNESL
jgi:hypothetical protein